MITYHPCRTSAGVFCVGLRNGAIYSLQWPGRYNKSILQPDDDNDLVHQLSADLNHYFAGALVDWNTYSIVMDEGTVFQRRVWQALRSIPYGHTVSYADIALQLGTKALRAVGSACGRNRVPILIPCHRVLNKNGKLGGYSSGLDKKQFLLQCETQSATIKK